MTLFLSLAVDKFIVNIKVSPLIAQSISVQSVENVYIQIKPSISALIYYSHCFLCSCSCVGHL